jgi:hypothetical protein
MSLTHQQLREIRRRAEAATGGPLEVWYEKIDGPSWDREVAVWSDHRVDYVIPPAHESEFLPADAELFAHAREDILALLGEVARLRRRVVAEGRRPYLGFFPNAPVDDFADLDLADLDRLAGREPGGGGQAATLGEGGVVG